MAADTNALGDRGESLFFLAITTFHGLKPLFRPAALGSKWPIADYVVELEGKPGRFFLVQVKTTRQGYLRNGRLRISIKRNRLELLRSAAVPAYLVAVDERKERAFIVAAPKATLASVSTSFSLNDAATRRSLRDEVKAFWDSSKRPSKSVFKD